jgi:hypothetical protein
MATIRKQNILNALVPQCCAYIWNDSSLIEVPQNDEELKILTNVVKNSGFRIIERAEALDLGYNELVNWSDENDYLFFVPIRLHVIMCA